MPTDKQNVEFLYSIIKQLEVKHIKWPTIAEENSIPNGHAARMRFHRLRQAMEGTVARPRTANPVDETKPKKRKARDATDIKLKKKLADVEEDSEDDEDVPLRARFKRRRVDTEDLASGDEYIPLGVQKGEGIREFMVRDEDAEFRIKAEHHEMRVKAEDGVCVKTSVKEEPRDEVEMLLDAAAALVPETETNIKQEESAKVPIVQEEDEDSVGMDISD